MAPASQRSSSGRISNIQVPRPAAGQSVTVRSRPGTNLVLEFDPSAATYSRAGNNLVFTLDDGSVVIIAGFFAVGDRALPTLTMQDGTTVEAVSFFAGTGLDMSTAEGPSAPRQVTGSGVGEFRSEAGELIDSVDTLDSLEYDAVSALSGSLTGLSAAVISASGVSAAPVTPPTSLEQPVPPVAPRTVDLTDPAAAPLNESGLADGTMAGLSKTSHDIVLPAGYRVDTAGWTLEAPDIFALTQGNFLLRYDAGTNTLAYELTAPFMHPDSSARNEELLSPIEIGLNLIHVADGLAHGIIRVQVLDDAPEIDIIPGYANLSGVEGDTVSGRFSLAFGTDGKNTDTHLSVSCNGVQGALQGDGVTYLFAAMGSLVVGMTGGGAYTGSYTFTPAAKGQYSLVFTAMDKDGDSSASGAVSVAIRAQDALDLTDQNALPLEESGLPSGSGQGNGNISHSITIPAGYQLDTSGWNDSGSGVFSIGQGQFILSYNSQTKVLTYELAGVFNHPDSAASHEPLPGPVPLLLSLIHDSGVSRDAYINVQVLDDAPQVDIPAGYGFLTGILGDDVTGRAELLAGADALAVGNGFRIACNGIEGVLRVWQPGDPPSTEATYVFTGIGELALHSSTLAGLTGEYTFTPSGSGSHTLTFSLTDSDGDTASDSINIRVRDTSALDITDPAGPVLNENGLPGGTQDGMAVISHAVALPSGYRLDTAGWAHDGSGNYSLAQGDFLLGYHSANRVLTYTLDGAFTHPDTSQAHELLGQAAEIAVTLVHDIDGPRDAFIFVQVRDDAPLVDVSGQDSLSGTEGVGIGGGFRLLYGADGEALSGALAITCAKDNGAAITGVANAAGTEYAFAGLGALVLSKGADGQYSYTFTAQGEGAYSLVFTGTDLEGDRHSRSVSVAVQSAPGPTPVDFSDNTAPDLYESGIVAGNGTSPGANIEASVVLSANMPQGWRLATAGWNENNGIFTTTTADNTFFLRYDSGSTELSYTLLNSFGHPEANRAGESLNAGIELKLTDSHGNSRDGFITVTVYDDAPKLVEGSTDIGGRLGEAISGEFTLVYGADGMHSQEAMTVACNGVAGIWQTDGQSIVFAGMGTLFLEQDAEGRFNGKFTFTAQSKNTYTLAFTAKDGDGDTASASVTVEAGIEPVQPVGSLSVDEALIGQNARDFISIAQTAPVTGVTWDMHGLPELWAMPDDDSGHERVVWEYDSDSERLHGFVHDDNGDKITVLELFGVFNNNAQGIQVELLRPVQHDAPSGVAVDRNTLPLTFSLTAHTQYGDMPVSFILEIRDSVPEAHDDQAILTDQTVVVTGNVLNGDYRLDNGSVEQSGASDVPGRDAPHFVSQIRLVDGGVENWTALSQGAGNTYAVIGKAGEYTLTVYSNGEYSFEVINLGLAGQVQFEYILQDQDGDQSRAKLDFALDNKLPFNLTENMDIAANALMESALPGGTDSQAKKSHSLDLSAVLQPGYALDTDGWSEDSGVFTQEQGHFKLTFTASTNILEYELIKAFGHADPAASGELLDSPATISLALEHATEGKRGAYIEVQVRDDAPLLGVGPDQAALLGDAVSGSFGAVFGGDGKHSATAWTFTCNGNAGTMSTDGSRIEFDDGSILVLAQDNDGYTGGYSFTGAATGEYRLGVTIRDADSDVVDGSLKITVSGGAQVVDFTDAQAPDLQEKGLDNGTSGGATIGYSVLLGGLMPSGHDLDTTGWQPDSQGRFVKDTDDGMFRLTYDPFDQELFYELLKATDHPLPDQANEKRELEISFRLTGGAGTATGLIKVQVADDSPVITNVTDDIGGPLNQAIAGSFDLAFGADAMHASTPVSVALGQEAGVLQADGLTFAFSDGSSLVMEKDNGQFTGKFVFTPTVKDDVSLTFTVRDGDGDSALTVVNVRAGLEPVPPADHLLLDEAAYPTTARLDITQEVPVTGIVWDAAAMPQLQAMPDEDSPYQTVTWIYDSDSERISGVVYDGANSPVTVIELYGELTGTPQAVQAELLRPVRHADPASGAQADENPLALVFNIKVQTRYGEMPLSFQVDIRDSVPQAMNDAVSITDQTTEVSGDVLHGTYATSDGLANPGTVEPDKAGKDAPLSVVRVCLVASGSENWMDLVYDSGLGKTVAEIDLGSGNNLTIYGDGKYVLSLPDPTTAPALSFKYTISDQDGDRSTALLDFAVQGTGPVDFSDPHAPSLNESGLDGGTQPGALIEHSVDLGGRMPAGYRLDAQGWDDDGQGGFSTAQGNFLLHYSPGSATLTYKLINNFAHPAPGEAHEALSAPAEITLSLVHDSQAPREGLIRVQVLDDAPEFDVAGWDSFMASPGEEVHGYVRLKFGADGAHGSEALSVVYNGKPYAIGSDGQTFSFDDGGSLVMDLAAGAFTGNYAFVSGEEGRHSLSFVARDGDGDPASSSEVVIVVMDALPMGSLELGEREGSSDTITISQASAVNAITWDSLPDLFSAAYDDSPYEAVQWTVYAGENRIVGRVPDGRGNMVDVIELRGQFDSNNQNITAELFRPLRHPAPASFDAEADLLSLAFGITAHTDAGDLRLSFAVDVTDSVPEAQSDQVTVGEAARLVSGNVVNASYKLDSDPTDRESGAEDRQSWDGPNLVSKVRLAGGTWVDLDQEDVSAGLRYAELADGQGNSLKIWEDGEYEYALAGALQAEARFEYYLADREGDRSLAALLFEPDAASLIGVLRVEDRAGAQDILEDSQPHMVTGIDWDMNDLPVLYALSAGSGEYVEVEWDSYPNLYMLVGRVSDGRGGWEDALMLRVSFTGNTLGFSAELLRPVLHAAPPQGQDSDANILTTHFGITLTTTGGVFKQSIALEIVDTVPLGSDDLVTVDADVRLVSGNALSASYRTDVDGTDQSSGVADLTSGDGVNVVARVRLGSGTWVELDQEDAAAGMFYAELADGRGNTLKIWENGDYEYTLSGTLQSDARFEYGLADRDGDYSSAELAFTPGAAPTVLDFTDPSAPDLDESGLPGGTDPSGVLEHTIDLGAVMPRGYRLDTAGWAGNGNILTSTAEGGRLGLSYNADSGELTYTLLGGFTHSISGKGEELDAPAEINLVLINAGGGVGAAVIKVQVLDDAPALDVSGHDNLSGSQSGVSGFVDISFGGDGSAAYGLSIALGAETVQSADIRSFIFSNGCVVEMEYGADGYTGNYVFTAPDEGTYELQFFARDRDGDESLSSRVVVQITAQGPLDISDSAAGPLQERALEYGTDKTLKVSHTLEIPPGYEVDTQGWTLESGLYYAWAGKFRLIYDAVANELTYRLISAFQHNNPSADNENTDTRIEVMLINTATGFRREAYIDVQVLDDAPLVSVAGHDNLTGTLVAGVGGHVEIKSGGDGMSGAFSDLVITCETNGTTVTGYTTDGYTYHFAGMGTLIMARSTSYANYSGDYRFLPLAAEQYSLQFFATDTDGDTRGSGKVVLNVDEELGGTAFIDESVNENYILSTTLPADYRSFAWDMASLPEVYASVAGQVVQVTWRVGSMQGNSNVLFGEALPTGWADRAVVFALVPQVDGREISFRIICGYTLIHDAPDAAVEADRNLMLLLLQFTVGTTDGNSYAGGLNLAITDAVPECLNDTVMLPAAALEVSGNVIDGNYQIDFYQNNSGLPDWYWNARNDSPKVAKIRVLAEGSSPGLDEGWVALDQGDPDDSGGMYAEITDAAGNYLKIYQSGAYEFFRNASALSGATMRFEYAVLDAEGDQARAELSFVSFQAEGSLGTLFFDEAGLDAGSQHADNVPTLETLSLQLELPFPSQVRWSISGQPEIQADPFQTGDYHDVTWVVDSMNQLVGYAGGVAVCGVAVIGNTFYYQNFLPIRHKAPAAGTDFDYNSLALEFKFTLYGYNGENAEHSLVVQVRDDAPLIAVDLENTQYAGRAGAPIEGLMDIVFGYDGRDQAAPLSVTCNGIQGASSDGGQSFTFAGVGRLVLQTGYTEENGMYYTGKYTFLPETGGDYTFVFTARDNDGDVVHSQPVRFLVAGGQVDPVDLGAGVVQEVYESGLAFGTDPGGKAVSHALVLADVLPQGYSVDTSGWEQDESSGVWSLTSALGNFVYTYDPQAGSLAYELIAPFLLDGKDYEEARLDVPLKDADGDAVMGFFSVKVRDDAPTLEPLDPSDDLSYDIVWNDNWMGFETVFGTVVLRVGADGLAGLAVSDGDNTPSRMQYSAYTITYDDYSWFDVYVDDKGSGEVHLNFSYTAGGDYMGGTRTFTLKAVDGDGNVISKTLTMNAEPGFIVLADDNAPYLSESLLPGGSGLDATTLSHTVSIPSGYRIDTSDMNPDGSGRFVYDAGAILHLYDADANTLTYTLQHQCSHSWTTGRDSAYQSLVYTFMLLDQDDKQVEGRLKIVVADDVPTVAVPAGNDSLACLMGGQAEGSLDFSFGGDGPYLQMGISCETREGTVHGQTVGEGTLEFEGVGRIQMELLDNEYTGNYTFTPTTAGEYTFIFTIEDLDGDRTSSGPVAISVGSGRSLSVSGGEYLESAAQGNDTVYGGSGDDTITLRGDSGSRAYGDDGNDFVYGSNGNDLIYGGRGDDLLRGGSGFNTFAWAAGDMDGGRDTVFFDRNTDKLYFEDLFADQAELLEMLLSKEIDLSVDSVSSLTLTTANQTVCLNLAEGGHISEQLAQSINSGTVEDKFELLQMMLTNTIS